MDGIKMIPYVALTIAIAGIIIGASAISVNKFQESMDNDGCFNASYQYLDEPTCRCNSTTTAIGEAGNSNMTVAGLSACLAKTSQTDVAEQLPTVAIIAVMVIIISVIAGVFVYMRYFA